MSNFLPVTPSQLKYKSVSLAFTIGFILTRGFVTLINRIALGEPSTLVNAMAAFPPSPVLE